MGIRSINGGIAEAILNDAVDKLLSPEAIKKYLHEMIDKKVDDIAGDLAHKIKADFIDLIDGEDDIK